VICSVNLRRLRVEYDPDRAPRIGRHGNDLVSHCEAKMRAHLDSLRSAFHRACEVQCWMLDPYYPQWGSDATLCGCPDFVMPNPKLVSEKAKELWYLLRHARRQRSLEMCFWKAARPAKWSAWPGTISRTHSGSPAVLSPAAHCQYP